MLKAVGKFLKNHKLDIITSSYFGYNTYQTEKEEGASTAGALASSALDIVLPFAISAAGYGTYLAASEAPGLIVNGVDSVDKWRRQLARENSTAAFNNAQFNDTEQVFTMRQAGMAVAQRSKYNTQLAMLGQEAKYMMR